MCEKLIRSRSLLTNLGLINVAYTIIRIFFFFFLYTNDRNFNIQSASQTNGTYSIKTSSALCKNLLSPC
jgi:hypothetical protein